MGRNMIIRGALAFSLLLGMSLVQAAGLGKLTVNSALGQILNAEIDLVSLQPGELDALNARVAPPEAFRDARIEYSSALRLLRFSVEKRASGQAFLKITSVAPINEPFVDMLIEVSWPAGRIQREYPILLDPPGYGRASPPTVPAAPTASRPADTPPASAPAVSSTPPAASAPAPSAPVASGQPSASSELASTPPGARSEGSASGSDTYGPVEKGDTLNKIATQVKPSDVSLEQMLVALYRENQSAFVNNNMNRLKTGQILKVPSADEVQKIAAKEANQEFRTHVADWKAYREQLAGGVAAIPARTESSNVAAGRVASAAVAPPTPPAADSKDVLKLSKSEAAKGAAAAGKGGASQERLNALQEELTAKDKALKDSQSRVSDLEKQIRDMQRLMDLKSGQPGKADAKVAAVAPPPTKAPEPAKVEPAKPAEPAKVEPPKAAEAPKPAEPPKVEPPKPAEPPKTETKVAEAPKVDQKPAAPKKAAPPPEKGFVDELMDNPWVLMAGVGGLAVLGIGGLLFMRRRRNAADAGPVSSMTSSFPSDLKPGSSTGGKSAGGLVDTGNSSFLTDFDKTGPGSIDTDEVDPVAEAEVYIAYGRDAQAEEILKEAMARDKGRHEIPLKLLEIYHARKSATAFETVAKELKASVGEGSPIWAKAAAMGSQIDPNNPLYAGGAGGSYTPAAASAAKPDVDFDIAGSSASTSAAAAEPSFDLDLDAKRAETTNTPTSSALDFDITPSAPTPAPDAEPPKEEKQSFDFDLSGLDFPGSKPAESAPASSSPAMTDLSLDMPSSGGGEAVGTKLELAKAYLEIGDKDGAREILQEVAKEGSAAQKEEAERLISSL